MKPGGVSLSGGHMSVDALRAGRVGLIRVATAVRDGATSAVVQAIINENPTLILHFHAASSGSRKNNLYRFLFISMPFCRIMCGMLMCCPYGDDFRLCLFHVATGTVSSSYTRAVRV